MDADQQNARLVGLKRMHRLHAGSRHLAPAGHAFVRPEPRHAGLHKPHPDGFEILRDHIVTLWLAHLRKTQLKIAVRDSGATLHKQLRETAQKFTQPKNNRVGKLYQKP